MKCGERIHLLPLLGAASALALGQVALLLPAASARPAGKEVYIAVTSNVKGLLTTCGTCDYVKVGAMSQKAAVLEKWRKQTKGALVVLDSGDAVTFGDGGRTLPIMLRAMDMCGYAFANVGDEDSALGLGSLRASARGLNLRWLSTNMLDASSGKPAFLTVGRLQVGKIRIGVLGILDQAPSGGGYTSRGDYRLEDPVESISRSLARSGIRRWADVIVLLAHAPLDEIRRIAANVPGIHLIVGGSEQAKPPAPELLDGTLFIQPHRYELGLVRFAVNPKTGPRPANWKLFTVPKNAPKDPRVESMISGGLARGSKIPPPRVGQVAPDIVLPSENGAPRTLSEFRGQKVVLGFYDFCQQCRDTAAKLAHLPGKPMLIAVVPFGKKDMQAFRRATGAQMLFLRDEKGAVALRYDALRCPSLFVVDEKGKLVYASRGFDASAPGAVRRALHGAAR